MLINYNEKQSRIEKSTKTTLIQTHETPDARTFKRTMVLPCSMLCLDLASSGKISCRRHEQELNKIKTTQ